MSGKHRKPDPDQLDQLDQLVEPRAAEPMAPVQVPPPPAPSAAPPSRRVAGSHSRPPAPADGRALVARESTPSEGPQRAAAAPGRTVVVRRDRRSERTQRKATGRRRTLAVVLGTGILAASVAVYWVTRTGQESTNQVAAGPAKQQTLLVQVTGDDGVAAASALVGVTAAENSSAIVLVPSRLLVDVAGAGSLPFGETATLPEPSAPAQALTDLLGVRVDDSWVLTVEGLAGVVDAVGGVQAAVDVDVVTTDAAGRSKIVVPAGSQRLDGTSAAAFATYLAEDEPEQARLARFDDVFTAVVAALPRTKAEIEAAVQASGVGSESTLGEGQLAARLSVLRASSAAGTLVSDVLPVTEYDSGGAVTSYGIDSGQVAAMMRSLLPGALQTDSGGEVLRVLVENGVGTPGLVELARAKLVADGFRFVNGGNAANFGVEESAVFISNGTATSVRRGERVASSLGLPVSAVTTSDRGQTVADVIVVLGKDFLP